MLTEQSIQDVKEAIQIEQVVSQHVTLKKSGDKYVGSCPFHSEKSNSFFVTPSKGIYKCFGCGASGDGVKFLMQHQHLSYPDAIRQLGKQFNVAVEEVPGNAEDKQIADKKTLFYELNAIVARYYQQNLLPMRQTEHWVNTEIDERRNFSDDTVIEFALGYAPDEWQFLTSKLSAEQLVLAKELGLVKDKDGKVYDTFRNRLIYPIVDQLSRVCGFTGRKPFDCQNEKNPKYFNSLESMVFKKGSLFFGLNLAEREIRSKRFAYLVEGQADVLAMHQMGLRNTIAASGTSFTADHAKYIKKYCPVIHIMTDGDLAGRKAALNIIDILLDADITPYVVPLPDGEDPDSFIRNEQKRLELEGLKA
jgi:DNA primase